MDGTPRKIPRLNKLVVVNAFTQTSIKKKGERDDNKIGKEKNEFIVINSSSTSKIQHKSHSIVNQSKKGKAKTNEASISENYQHDSDFEDKIPIAKRLRLNTDSTSSEKSCKKDKEKNNHIGVRTLTSMYFLNATDKVLKVDFLRVFNEEGLIRSEHMFNMTMIYIISTFIFSSPPNNSHIPKDHFLCVESAQYSTYSWGNLSFFN
ncbi:hypothetical protein H5410_036638 [Solanum commersonii]|uniref:DUF1985 domain-containing protein n=1 Tax=Solanum commersonii TaxID=4109 RepID=A0A9J5Y8S2_SOLCO|nr:hypothetical protein H5410_036638 [Solanum commersonii]